MDRTAISSDKSAARALEGCYGVISPTYDDPHHCGRNFRRKRLSLRRAAEVELAAGGPLAPMRRRRAAPVALSGASHTHTHVRKRERPTDDRALIPLTARSTMKLLALLLTGAAAFAPAVKPLAARTVSQKMMPEALDVVSQMPSQLLSLEVTEAAFMAVVLGTFVPCVFLITLYIQSEAALLGERVDERA